MKNKQAKEQGDAEAQSANQDFVEALEYGLPPTVGCGFGIDRIIMLLSNVHQIRVCFFFQTFYYKQININHNIFLFYKITNRKLFCSLL